MNPYYQDDSVTLYHGDCREIDTWESAHLLLTDPPYGIDWGVPERKGRKAIVAIANDRDTAARDYVIGQWGHIRPAVVFGSPILPPPFGTKQTLVWEKTLDSGVLGTVAGFRRNWEAIYLLGNFPQLPATDSSVIRSSVSTTHAARNIGHAHTKPVPLLERLLGRCPGGTVADPFTGSGSSLIAARNLGRKAIGVELDEAYCEIAARRLDQMSLDFGSAS